MTTLSPSATNQEALRKIDEIHEILSAGDQIALSRKKMCLIGLLILSIPLIEWATQSLTFGFDFGDHASFKITLVHIGFYWGLSRLMSLAWRNDGHREDRHPIVRKAFAIIRPYWMSCAAVSVAFVMAGQPEFIYPVILILMGILFNLYGRFSSRTVLAVSWSYIVLGALAIAFMNRLPEWTGYALNVYQGLSFIGMGLSRGSR